MANPDDEGFDDFVRGLLNTTVSSVCADIVSSDDEDILLHNMSNSEDEDPPGSTQQFSADGWNNVTNVDPGPQTIPIYNVNEGPVLPVLFDGDYLPIDYFSLFFNEDILSFICNETNLFAEKRKSNVTSPHARVNKWNALSPIELKAFLGVIINMGIKPLPNLESYFTKKWVDRIPFFSDVFSKNEFLNIFWNLHFNHDSDGVGNVRPKGFLIQPLLEHMKTMCQMFYTPSNNVAIDESTISFKGRVSFRVYNPMKPTKFGLKIFVLSDCVNGYMYNFIPYYGKEELIPNSKLLKTTQIVKVLTESVVFKSDAPTSGLHVFTDRYYTSPEVAKELLSINTYITGTVMPNRVGMPPRLKTESKSLKKGQILSQRKSNVLVCSWKDKRVVHVLSTFSKGSKDLVTECPSKWPNMPSTKKPDVVLNYTKHMGAVDRSDHFISSYQFMRRTRKWYRKMFFWLLEVAIVNSYILYRSVQINSGKKPLVHLDFRKSLVESLVAEKIATRPTCKRGRPAQGPPEQRLNGSQHFMDKRENGKRTRCVVCFKRGERKETVYFCKSCVTKPGLHPENCFEAYHTRMHL